MWDVTLLLWNIVGTTWSICFAPHQACFEGQKSKRLWHVLQNSQYKMALEPPNLRAGLHHTLIHRILRKQLQYEFCHQLILILSTKRFT